MNIDEARDLGKQAYADGKPAAPAFDKDFMDRLSSDGAIALLEAWIRGWHKANLDAPVATEKFFTRSDKFHFCTNCAATIATIFSDEALTIRVENQELCADCDNDGVDNYNTDLAHYYHDAPNKKRKDLTCSR